MEINFLIIGIEIVVAVVIAIIYIKSRLPKETIDQQAKLIDALQKRLESMEEDQKILLSKHVENEKKIATLEGKIQVYKELPLKDIADSLKILESLPTRFQEITQNNGNRIIAAVENIKVQNVERQNVANEVVNNKVKE